MEVIDNNIFGEVISSYTDDDAIEDGILVDIEDLDGMPTLPNGNVVTRCTSNLYWSFKPSPNFVPTGDGDLETIQEKIVEIVSLIVTAAKYDREWYVLEYEGRTFWCIPNELSTYTLMYPEDY